MFAITYLQDYRWPGGTWPLAVGKYRQAGWCRIQFPCECAGYQATTRLVDYDAGSSSKPTARYRERGDSSSLTINTVSVPPAMYRPTLYAVLARTCDSAFQDPSERMRPDDVNLIDTDVSPFEITSGVSTEGLSFTHSEIRKKECRVPRSAPGLSSTRQKSVLS